MGMGDKIANQAEKLKGQAKEAAGKLTGNEQLEAEGKTDQVVGEAKQTGEKVKDTVRKTFKD